MANTSAPDLASLVQACQSLSKLAIRCASAAERAQLAGDLMRAGSLAQLQLAIQPLQQALTTVQAEANSCFAQQGVLDANAPIATPTGVPFDSELREHGLSFRTYSVLRAGEIGTIRELCSLDLADFMKFRNCGKVTLAEIINFRKTIGMPLEG